MKAFLQARPDVDVELLDTDSTDVWQLVESGQVDMGFASAPGPTRQLTFAPLFSEPFRLVCHAGSEIAEMPEPIEWRDLDGADLIMNEALRAVPAMGFKSLADRSRLSVRNVNSLIALVAADMGVTLLPRLATINLPPDVTSRALADASCCRTVGAILRTDKVISPLTRAFQAVIAMSVAK